MNSNTVSKPQFTAKELIQKEYKKLRLILPADELVDLKEWYIDQLNELDCVYLGGAFDN